MGWEWQGGRNDTGRWKEGLDGGERDAEGAGKIVGEIKAVPQGLEAVVGR